MVIVICVDIAFSFMMVIVINHVKKPIIILILKEMNVKIVIKTVKMDVVVLENQNVLKLKIIVVIFKKYGMINVTAIKKIKQQLKMDVQHVIKNVKMVVMVLVMINVVTQVVKKDV